MTTKGKSTRDLLNIDIADFNKMTRSELSSVVSRLGSTTNKRLRYFQSANKTSPAVSGLQRSGGKITAKGKTINELRAEYVRAKNFLQAETSTIKGYKAFRDDTIKSLNIEGVEDLSEKQFTKLWQAYEKLKDMSPEVNDKKFKYTVIREIADEMLSDGRISSSRIAERVQTRLSNIYEENAENDRGVSEFFEFE